MPISRNASHFTGVLKGEGRAVSVPGEGREGSNTGNTFIMPQIAPGLMGKAVAVPQLSKQSNIVRPNVATISNLVVRPEIFTTLQNQTATQIARGAIQQLNRSNISVIDEAIKTITNRRINSSGLMNYLERKTKVGEVLNELATDWEDETREDFVEAFRMAPNKLNVMDSIVSMAVLNDPDLDDELLAENFPETNETDLLENRRITWQYPPAGTILNPPYVMLVAVEHQDLAEAQEALESILDQLTTYQGFRLPKTTVSMLKRQSPGK